MQNITTFLKTIVLKASLGPCMFLFFLLYSISTKAQTPADYGYNTNGIVTTSIMKGDTLYIGGGFSSIGRHTGSLAGVNTTTGKLNRPALPTVNGPIDHMIEDGAGGYFITGTFTKVGDKYRNRFAHIVRTSYGQWAVATLKLEFYNGISGGGGLSSIDCLTVSPNADTLFVVGSFQSVSNGSVTVNKSYFAAIKLSTSTVISGWGGITSIFGTIRDISCSADGKLFIGGNFVRITSAGTNYNIYALAALDRTTGLLIPTWDAKLTNSSNGTSGMTINTLTVSGDTLFIGGSGFANVSTQTGRNGVAAMQTEDAKPCTAWDVVPQGSVTIRRLKMQNNQLLIGGIFTTIKITNTTLGTFTNYTRPGFAAINSASNATPTITNWTCPIGSNVFDFAIDITTGVAYILGGAGINTNVMMLQLSNNNTQAFNMTTNGSFGSMRVYFSDGLLLASGDFNFIQGQPANGFGGIDLKNDQILPYSQPAGPGVFVNALALSKNKDTLYVGGNFTSFSTTPSLTSNVTRGYIAMIKISSGNLLPWNTTTAAGNGVQALEIDTTRFILYAGGNFNKLNGTSRSNLAALDSRTGTLISTWTADVTQIGTVVPVRDLVLSPGGDTLYVGGTFSAIAGGNRNNVAALFTGVTSASLIPGWDPDLITGGSSNAVYTLALVGNHLYAGGDFTKTMGSVSLYNLVDIDRISGVVNSSWKPAISGSLEIIKPTPDGKDLFIGGSFGQLNGVTPQRWVGIVPTDADGTSYIGWNPYLNYSGGGEVYTVQFYKGKVYLGGRFTTVSSDVDASTYLTTTVDPPTDIDVTLPLYVTSIILHRYDKAIGVQWSTDRTAVTYQLERSLDKYHFVTLANVNSSGDYIDKSVFAGNTYYYRLKIKEGNGSIYYSITPGVNLGKTPAVNISGNLLTRGQSVNIIAANKGYVFAVFDASGRLLVNKELKPGNNVIYVPVTSSGAYPYVIEGNNEKLSGKLIIQ